MVSGGVVSGGVVSGGVVSGGVVRRIFCRGDEEDEYFCFSEGILNFGGWQFDINIQESEVRMGSHTSAPVQIICLSF